MAEPVSSSSLGTAAVLAAPLLTVLGVSTGLRTDVLMAGFAGSLASMVLLNTVPSLGDTWIELIRTTAKRMSTAAASSLMAGYLAPALLDVVGVSESKTLALSFVAGAGAQWVLKAAVDRLSGVVQAGSKNDA